MLIRPCHKAKLSLTLTCSLAALLILSACRSLPGFSSPLSNDEIKIALDFAQALVDGEFEFASSLLVPEIRQVMTPEQLRLDYEGMIGMYLNPASAQVIFDPQFTMTDWPGRRPNDVGWVYVSIVGDDFVEAVSVILAEQDEVLLIREIDWGRP